MPVVLYLCGGGVFFFLLPFLLHTFKPIDTRVYKGIFIFLYLVGATDEGEGSSPGGSAAGDHAALLGELCQVGTTPLQGLLQWVLESVPTRTLCALYSSMSAFLLGICVLDSFPTPKSRLVDKKGK